MLRRLGQRGSVVAARPTSTATTTTATALPATPPPRAALPARPLRSLPPPSSIAMVRATVSALALLALAGSSAASSGLRLERRAHRAHDLGLAEAEHTLTLSSHPSPNHLTSRLRNRLRHLGGKTSRNQIRGEAPATTLDTSFAGVYPMANVTWPGPKGDQVLQQYLDTGSSDTFVVESGCECISMKTHKKVAQSHCRWGPAYDRSRGAFESIPSEDFDIDFFPEGEHLHGEIGWSGLSFGGASIPRTKVAMVNHSSFIGDGHSSGLIGMAYPGITSAFKSTGARDDYDPVFVSMIKQNVVKDGIFTLAINRVGQDASTYDPAGVLALGGLVSPSLYDAPLTTVPIEETISQPGNLSLYALTHTLSWRGAKQGGRGKWTHFSSKGKKQYQSIVDSGTAAVFVPTHAAKEINALFDPPGQPYGKDKEYWTVDCDARPPEVSFKFGGKHWHMDGRDMIVRQLTGLPGAEHTCFSAIADGGSPSDDAMILGAVWQRTVVVGYDMGRSKLHFAPRKAY